MSAGDGKTAACRVEQTERWKAAEEAVRLARLLYFADTPAVSKHCPDRERSSLQAASEFDTLLSAFRIVRALSSCCSAFRRRYSR